MFGTMTKRFQELFASLAGKKQLSSENIADAVRAVRLALLDADVNYTVVSNLVKKIKEQALGAEVLRSVTPGQQFTKIVHDALIALMGSAEACLWLDARPSVFMLCGLQGSGKTTQCAKLGYWLQRKECRKRVLLAACDLQRPAAVGQLRILGNAATVEVFSIDGATEPRTVAKGALAAARDRNFDVLIVDTAGRLHVDDALMHELVEMREILQPHEVLFVANATTGQDAVKTAAEFDQRVGITGTILTMLDGDTRAGAALSIREITGKPLKFEGVGEKVTDLQLFNPRSMADRILGMGDVVNLVRKVQEHVDEEEAAKLEEKLRKASFTYADYLRQMRMVKKMGSLKSMWKMLPGVPDVGDLEESAGYLARIEATILSMTPAERAEEVELVPSRRRRIADGSGVSIEDVNKMVKSFKQLKRFLKDAPLWKQKVRQSGLGRGD